MDRVAIGDPRANTEAVFFSRTPETRHDEGHWARATRETASQFQLIMGLTPCERDSGLPATGYMHHVTLSNGGGDQAHYVLPRIHNIASLLMR